VRVRPEPGADRAGVGVVEGVEDGHGLLPGPTRFVALPERVPELRFASRNSGSGSWRRAGNQADPRANCTERCRQKLESQLSSKAPPGKGAAVGQAFAWLVSSSVPGGAG
jgi:hypothetical protein